MKKLLVVVDMQNDFVDGALANAQAKESIPYIKEQIESADYVIYTKDTHDENYLNTQEGRNLPVPHCIEGTQGWEIVDELKPSNFPDKESSIMIKHTFGAPWQTVDADFIKSFDEVMFVGTCTDICVISNVLCFKALYPEMPISVSEKCCSGVTLEKHLAALEAMRSCQVNVMP